MFDWFHLYNAGRIDLIWNDEGSTTLTVVVGYITPLVQFNLLVQRANKLFTSRNHSRRLCQRSACFVFVCTFCVRFSLCFVLSFTSSQKPKEMTASEESEPLLQKNNKSASYSAITRVSVFLNCKLTVSSLQ